MKRKICLFVTAVLLVGTMLTTLVGCGGDKSTVYSSDTVLSENTTISNELKVGKGATLIVPEDKELRLDSGAKFNVAGEIDLRGKLYVKGIAWKDLFDGNSGSLNLYKSCDVYIDDEHVVGDEYDYSAAILLGNQSYAAYEADDSVMKIDGTEDSVVISGKVYLNKTISDDRAWDLGYDSAAVLYENQKIRFKSVRNAKKSVTATVYTYGGTNDEKTSQMPNLQSQYIYNKNKWIEADARTMEGIVQYTAMMMSFLQERSPAVGTEWNGNTNYDTTAGSDGQRIADLKYADRSGSRNVYDLWLPKSLVDGKNKDKKQKLILFIHGGSWSSGKKEDVAMLCAMYAKMGYITASLNYRLSEQSLPQDSGTLPQMDEDVFDCVMAIKAEMTKRGYDVDGMAVSGQSAGGHLALLYAGRHYETAAKPSAIPVKLVLSEFGPAEFSIETWANDRLIWDRKDIEKQNRWSRVYENPEDDPNWTEKQANAVQFLAGMLELSGFELTKSGTDSEGNPIFTDKILQTIIRDELIPGTETYNNLATFSPAHNWGEGKCMIPVVGIHGEMDTTVSFVGPKKLDKKLTELGIDHKYVITPLNGHAQAEDATAYHRYYDISKEYLDKFLKLN